MRKINGLGEYTFYPGITIIHKLADVDLCNQIYDLVNSNNSLKRTYAPLPSTSYHMTLVDLFTTNNVNIDFKLFMAEHQESFVRLDSLLKENPVYDTAIASEMYFKNTFGIWLKFDDDSLLKFREMLGKHLNIPLNNDYRFHITLGYKYSKVRLDLEVMTDLHQQLEALLKKRDYKIRLLPETLSYFNNMKHFYPYIPS